MNIPGLDTLLYRTFWALHRLGRIHTVRDLAAVDPDRIRSILVAVTTALGDSVTFTPALAALRERFPLARIVGLFHRNFADLYLADPRLDEVIPYHGKYKRWHRTLKALKVERCELALVPYINDPDVIPLIYLGGSRIIFRTPGRNTIYRFMVANPELLSSKPNLDHALVRCATMLRHLGCAIPDLAPTLHIDQSSRERAAAWLRAHGILRGVQLVGMHPGASIREKRWPAENFAEVARALLRENAERWLILTGSGGERALCERIRAACGAPDRAVNAAGGLPLADLPALLGRVRWLLTNDTGVAHIAYATGTPSLTLFWRSDPAISGPMQNLDRHQVIACQPLCPPCRPRTCRYPACAREITPNQVLAAALSLLSGTGVARGTGMGA
jgi:ADP-heptose:LPS heptosyltransferase